MAKEMVLKKELAVAEPSRKSSRTKCPRIGPDQVIEYDSDPVTGCRVVRSIKTLAGATSDFPVRNHSRGVFINKSAPPKSVKRTTVKKKLSKKAPTRNKNSKVAKKSKKANKKNLNVKQLNFFMDSSSTGGPPTAIKLPKDVSLARPRVAVPLVQFNGNSRVRTEMRIHKVTRSSATATKRTLTTTSRKKAAAMESTILRRSARQASVRANSMRSQRLEALGTSSGHHELSDKAGAHNRTFTIAGAPTNTSFTKARSTGPTMPPQSQKESVDSFFQIPASIPVVPSRPASSASLVIASKRKVPPTAIVKKQPPAKASNVLSKPTALTQNSQGDFEFRHPMSPDKELEMILEKGTRNVILCEVPGTVPPADEGKNQEDETEPAFVANYVMQSKMTNAQNQPAKKGDAVQYTKLLRSSAEEAGYITITPGHCKGGTTNSKNTRLTFFVSRGVAKIYLNEVNRREFLPLGERGVVGIKPGQWYDIEAVQDPTKTEYLELFFMRSRADDKPKQCSENKTTSV